MIIKKRFPFRIATRVHLLVLGIYALLAVALSYPLPLHIATHVPGSATWALDEYSFVWNLWWFRHALLALGQSPLHTNHIFYPVGADLGLYTMNLLNGALAISLLPLWPLPVVHNVQWWGSTALSAFGAYLLATHLLRKLRPSWQHVIPLAAFVAGLIYAFTSYRASFVALGHYSTTVGEWSPFFILYFLRTLRYRSLKHPFLAGLFLAFTVLASHTMAALTGVAAALYFFLSWRAHRAKNESPAGESYFRLAAPRLAVMAAVTAVVGSPAIIQVARAAIQSDFVLNGWGDALTLSADLFGFFTPSALHPLWGQDWATYLQHVREGTARFTDVNMAFIGFATPALALVGLIVHRRHVSKWAVLALLFALFSLGPLLHINGQTQFDLDGLQMTVPLPYIVLHYVPLLKANRVPSRNMTMLMLMLAILAGYGTFWLQEKVTNWRAGSALAVALIGLILFEHLAIPLPLTDARTPEIYRQIAADPGDFAILSLPIGWRNSFGVLGVENTRTQYYQAAHGKRLLSGNTSRNPPFTFDYFRRLPVISSLIALETYGQVTPQQQQLDRELVDQFIAFFDLRYVVIAPAVAGRPPFEDTRQRTAHYVLDLFPLEEIYEQEGTEAFRVIQPPAPSVINLDLGTPQALMGLGEGWDKNEIIAGQSAVWVSGTEARLFLPIREPNAPHTLTLRGVPFAYPGAPSQTFTVLVNGSPLSGTIRMAPLWESYTLAVPERFLHAGLNEVDLRFGYAARPSDVLPGRRAIGSTGVETPVDIEVTSGRSEAGSLAYIMIGGQDASAHRDGYNVAVVDPQAGQMLDSQGFDTTANRYEADRLAQFLNGIPDGYIVVFATRGTAAQHLTKAARTALQHSGAQRIPTAEGPQPYAMIGVQGAAPGTALESVPDQGNAYLRLGHNPDRRPLSAAFDWLEWSTGNAE